MKSYVKTMCAICHHDFLSFPDQALWSKSFVTILSMLISYLTSFGCWCMLAFDMVDATVWCLFWYFLLVLVFCVGVWFVGILCWCLLFLLAFLLVFGVSVGILCWFFVFLLVFSVGVWCVCWHFLLVFVGWCDQRWSAFQGAPLVAAAAI